MEVFSAEDVKRLLWKKLVVVIGDSIQRCIYKDLVALLTPEKHGGYLSSKELKTKGEPEFLQDKLLEGGQMGEMRNGINYREVRIFDNQYSVIKFYFVTRCYSEYMEEVLEELKAIQPHVVIMNSCLWDIHRYGPYGSADYAQNLHRLMDGMNSSLPSDAIFIWNSALPLSSKCKGGFLLPLYDTIPSIEILEANFVARDIILSNCRIFLDLHLFFSNYLDYRAADGVHWNHVAHRIISNLILSKIKWSILVARKMIRSGSSGMLTLPSRLTSLPRHNSFGSYSALEDRYDGPCFTSPEIDNRYFPDDGLVDFDTYRKRFQCLSSKVLSLNSTESSPVITKTSTPVVSSTTNRLVGLKAPVYHSSPIESNTNATFVKTVPLAKEENFDDLPISAVFESSVDAKSNSDLVSIKMEDISSYDKDLVHSNDTSTKEEHHIHDQHYSKWYETHQSAELQKDAERVKESIKVELLDDDLRNEIKRCNSLRKELEQCDQLRITEEQSIDLRKEIEHCDKLLTAKEQSIDLRKEIERSRSLKREREDVKQEQDSPLKKRLGNCSVTPVSQGVSPRSIVSNVDRSRSVRLETRHEHCDENGTSHSQKCKQQASIEDRRLARDGRGVKRKADNSEVYNEPNSRERKNARVDTNDRNSHYERSDSHRDHRGVVTNDRYSYYGRSDYQRDHRGLRRSDSYPKAQNNRNSTHGGKGRFASAKAKTSVKLSSVVSKVSSVISNIRRPTSRSHRGGKSAKACDKLDRRDRQYSSGTINAQYMYYGGFRYY
ncbi:uncharacterized protein LOC5521374 isoform X2 [Nematostella vectensis]|uniref:uncharacterized protein LOC5521374 isoform X2 n=1 Tax=Nematostella vectensis TaxID=45351 RepID=UPI0013905D50|nr:uncharacterized protein LOC5521374 isoform X2 [Nematostella vectensis]